MNAQIGAFSETLQILRQKEITEQQENYLFDLSRHISKPARSLLIDYLKDRLNRNVNGGARRELIEALQKLQC